MLTKILHRSVFAAALALASCGGAGGQVGSTAPIAAATAGTASGQGSAAAIAASLEAAGLPCTDLTTETGATYVASEVRCSIGGDDVIIRTFGTSEDRDRYMEASGTFVGQLSMDVEAPPQLLGPTWIVTTDTLATAERIRQVLGGSLR